MKVLILNSNGITKFPFLGCGEQTPPRHSPPSETPTTQNPHPLVGSLPHTADAFHPTAFSSLNVGNDANGFVYKEWWMGRLAFARTAPCIRCSDHSGSNHHLCSGCEGVQARHIVGSDFPPKHGGACFSDLLHTHR